MSESKPDYSFAQLPSTLPRNREPLIITEPGDYVTRNGTRVTIHAIVPYVPRPGGPLRHEVTAFEAKGALWRVFCGKVRPRGIDAWHLTGAYRPVGGEHKFDIVGRWEDAQ